MMTLDEIAQQVQDEWQMCGLAGPDNLYGDFASEVAKRYAAQQTQRVREILREAIANPADTGNMYDRVCDALALLETAETEDGAP